MPDWTIRPVSRRPTISTPSSRRTPNAPFTPRWPTTGLPDALEDYRRILSAGVNVVGSSAVFLQYPWQVIPEELFKPIEDAAQAGKSSLFVNGIDPGFANDLLPLALAGTCESIEQIRCMEIINYDTYDSTEVMFDVMGFGKPLDETPMLLQPGVLSLAWGSVIRQLAAGLGISLDEVTETYVREPAPEDFDIASGHIAKGTAAALRFEVRGMLDGKPAVVLEHVTRLRDDLHPEWPQPAQSGGSYRIEITGEPSYALDLCLSSRKGDHNHAGLVATAARVVNAIPAVVAALPGSGPLLTDLWQLGMGCTLLIGRAELNRRTCLCGLFCAT